MPSRSRPWLPFIAIVLTLSGILLIRLAHRSQDLKPPSTQLVSPGRSALEQGAQASAKNTTPGFSQAAARAVATLTPERRLADMAERARLARQLEEARQAREARPHTATLTAAESGQEPGLDKAYLREQMLEIMPLVKECYETALDSNPKLAGRLYVHFNIVAEPQIGGLVDSSEVEREGPLGQEPALVACVQESMYALKLKAPRGGGQVKVSYPFLFKNDGPPDGG